MQHLCIAYDVTWLEYIVSDMHLPFAMPSSHHRETFKAAPRGALDAAGVADPVQRSAQST